jgi:prepilin-type processing-associated H-X9-DG protein
MMRGAGRAGHNPRAGLGLIELLLVISIIALLIALVLPAVGRSREAARRIQCVNNLKQVGLALHTYHDSARVFPPGYVTFVSESPGEPATDLGPGWAWGSMLLPQMEQHGVYNAINFELEVTCVENRTATITRISSRICPSDPNTNPASVRYSMSARATASLSATNYVGVYGPGRIAEAPGNGRGVFFRNISVGLVDLTDGSSQTIVVGERSSGRGQATWVGRAVGGWVVQDPQRGRHSGPVPEPEEAWAMVLGSTGSEDAPAAPCDPRSGLSGFDSRHLGGANFAFGDGSVRFVRETIDPVVYRALSTRAGEELISAESF